MSARDATPARPVDLVGLIPAAGRATRLGELPCSKELLPIGYQPGTRGPRPKPVSQYLLDQYRRAGCDKALFIVREGKWDIPNYYGCGRRFGMDLGYLLMNEPYGPPFTLAQALPFIGEATVLLGFPDILIDPPDAFAQVLAVLHAGDADVVLASYPATAADACDLVAGPLAQRRGPVTRLVPKEEKPGWDADSHAWLFACWRPTFSAFLARDLARLRGLAAGHDPARPPEWPVGTVMASALQAGLRLQRLHFPQGRFLDVGAPERLVGAATFPGVWNGRGQA
ncbi:MAG: NTP transferase domain-containing protein [Burkholderiaceae bacterium]